MCYFSKLGHVTHYKAKKGSTVKTNFRKCTHARTHKHAVNRIAWRFQQYLKDVSVFDDLTLLGRLFQTDSAA